MKMVDNYEAKIWLGLQKGYSNSYFEAQEITEVIKKWCTEEGQCVTVSPTHFVYVDGEEPGLVIGFINYARYPKSKAEISNRAHELGRLLMKKFKQFRVSITFYPTFPNSSIMLENEDITEISTEDCMYFDLAQERKKCMGIGGENNKCIGINCGYFKKKE
jgi:hypothetical protein